ncbi:hypothetical protein SAMN05660690_2949 [Geodermatophilus telluris]|uniref:MalT-like TPR region domain-containing protein n=1 Tax=Geodermatophilus telluris TaxID=1190417 RepID=A0A1G6QJL4_9ACTN|nr:hypothetical protein [Geodermatophilus telluris]SDC92361.1 hypothetical protein SAMN05660690_2949 [Geodermatophilus telluris]
MAAAALHHLGLLAADIDGGTETASRLLHESLDTYRDLGLSRFSALLLVALGDLALRRGERDLARCLLTESLQLMMRVTDRLSLHLAVDCVAHLALEEGEARRAVRLAGGAARLRALHGVRDWPAVERRRAAWLTVAREVLPPATFAAAWAEGQAITLDQTVAAALSTQACR